MLLGKCRYLTYNDIQIACPNDAVGVWKMKAKKIEKIRNEATSRVNKESLVQFRLEPEILDRLYEEANKLGLPVGTMVRMWVMERLNEKSA